MKTQYIVIYGKPFPGMVLLGAKVYGPFKTEKQAESFMVNKLGKDKVKTIFPILIPCK